MEELVVLDGVGALPYWSTGDRFGRRPPPTACVIGTPRRHSPGIIRTVQGVQGDGNVFIFYFYIISSRTYNLKNYGNSIYQSARYILTGPGGQREDLEIRGLTTRRQEEAVFTQSSTSEEKAS